MQCDEDKPNYSSAEYNQKVREINLRFWGKDNVRLCERLATLIGDPFDDKDIGRRFIVDLDKPKVRDIIDALHGPNGHTVMKMLEARSEQ